MRFARNRQRDFPFKLKEIEIVTEAEIDLFRQRLGKELEPAFRD